MKLNIQEILKEISSRLPKYFNKSILISSLYFAGGTILFIGGVIIYGIILNIREDTLSEKMKEKGFFQLVNTSILIERKNYTLSLYEDSVLIKTYKANFGRNLNSDNHKPGDKFTPAGEYLVCSIDTLHKYHKFLRLNYPNLQDAGEGLRKGMINQKEYDQLKFEYYYGECPKLETAIGTNIGIHGIGDYNIIFKNLPFAYNWTDGSIAVSNENIDELYSVIKKGTKVVIK